MRISAPVPAPAEAAVPKNELRAAAAAFEATMLKQLLQSAMPAPDGAVGDWRGLALDGFARDFAASHPFGLARLLETRP